MDCPKCGNELTPVECISPGYPLCDWCWWLEQRWDDGEFDDD